MKPARAFFACAISLAAACAPTGGHRTAPGAGELTVGVSEIDITPEEPIRLTGYGSRTAPSEGIVDRSMNYYGQPGPLAEGTEEQIVRTVKELAPAVRRASASHLTTGER